MNRLIGALFLGVILNGCAPVEYDSVHVYTPGRHHATFEKPVVTFSPQQDVMTETGVSVREGTYYGSRSVDMTAPDVILGPGDYYQKRYSPSIFKDGRR